MGTEPNRDPIARAFRESYDQIVDQVQITEPEWPPIPTVSDHGPPDRSNLPWLRAAAAISALAVVFTAGWLISPDPATPTNESSEGGIDTAAAVPHTGSAPHTSPNDAAIATALSQDPGLDNPRVTRMVTIFADDTMVDLRVEAQDDGFCHWYGVLGTIHQGRLEWRGRQPSTPDPVGSCTAT